MSSTHSAGCAYVYLLRCRDRTVYTGWTTELDRRIARHQAGTGTRYTRGRLPVKLVYAERLPDRRQARRREWNLRRLSHQEKAKLAGRVVRLRGRERARSKARLGLEVPGSAETAPLTWVRRGGDRHDG